MKGFQAWLLCLMLGGVLSCTGCSDFWSGGAKEGGPVFLVSDQAGTIASAEAVFDWLEGDDRNVFVGVLGSQMPSLDRLRRLSGKTGAEIVSLADHATVGDGSEVVMSMCRTLGERELRSAMSTSITTIFQMSSSLPAP